MISKGLKVVTVRKNRLQQTTLSGSIVLIRAIPRKQAAQDSDFQSLNTPQPDTAAQSSLKASLMKARQLRLNFKTIGVTFVSASNFQSRLNPLEPT